MAQPSRPERSGKSEDAARRRPRERNNEAPEPALPPEANAIHVRRQRFLVASARPDHRTVTQMLAEDPDVHLVRPIQPSREGVPPVAIVEMPADHAARIAATPGFHVEADQPLRYGTAAIPHIDPGVAPQLDSVDLTVQVDNTDGEPLAGAAVYVFATQFPSQATTGEDGRATLHVPSNEVELIDGIYARPRAGHWSAWLGRPRLSTKNPNPVVCARLDPSKVDGWARRAMGFDRLPPTYRGHGVKVAIIDSGLTIFDDLPDQVGGGHDHVTQKEGSWRVDQVGFGTLAANIFTAGLAPEAELHICKVFPGGRFGELVEAIDYCLAHSVDIISLGLGSPYPSMLVAQKIEEARQAGIATIAAAGSTAGPVSFPASLPTVLAVGAIGKLGTFPPESYHATQILGVPTPDGYFSARFSAYGPEIGVCAPGVAVVSTGAAEHAVALDGTAVAVPHVAALATLMLAHHHDFRNGYRARNAARVQRLFEIILDSCRAWPFADRMRIGAGMPDAVAALGLLPGQERPVGQPMSPLWAAMIGAGVGVDEPISYEYEAGGLGQLRAAMRSAGLAPNAMSDS